MILQILTPRIAPANIEFAKQKCCYNKDGTVDYSIDLLIRNLAEHPLDRIRIIIPARLKGATPPKFFLRRKKNAAQRIRDSRKRELLLISCCSDELSMDAAKWVYRHTDRGLCDCDLIEPEEKHKVTLERKSDPKNLGVELGKLTAEIRNWDVQSPKEINDYEWFFLFESNTTLFDLVPAEGQEAISPASKTGEISEKAMGWFSLRFTTAAEAHQIKDNQKHFEHMIFGRNIFQEFFRISLGAIDLSLLPFPKQAAKFKVGKAKLWEKVQSDAWTIAQYFDWRIFAYGNTRVRWAWAELRIKNDEGINVLPKEAFPFRGPLVRALDKVKRKIRREDRRYVYKRICIGTMHEFDAQTAGWKVEWWHENLRIPPVWAIVLFLLSLGAAILKFWNQLATFLGL